MLLELRWEGLLATVSSSSSSPLLLLLVLEGVVTCADLLCLLALGVAPLLLLLVQLLIL